MFLGSRIDHLNQASRDPLDIGGALPSLESEASILPLPNEISQRQEPGHTSGNTLPTPLEASSTSTLADNHAVGSSGTSGHTTNGSDKELSRKDSTRSSLSNQTPLPLQEGRPMTTLVSYAAPDSSTLPTGTEEWPQLPGPGAERLHGASEPLTPDTMTNAPEAGHPVTATNTLNRRQRTAARSKKTPNPRTACFSPDTPVLIASQGTAQWKMIYKAEKGESVVQLLPSGNIMDLTDAITTPIRTLCCFDTPKGDNDMVKVGISTVTPHHHILTEEGWMTARQAAARGQGTVFSSRNERVYNFLLEGGGNIIINTSCLPGATILTTAATMGYLFTPTPDSQQIGSLTYPEDIRTRLGVRQDLSKAYAHFLPGEVKTLFNGELILKNITGDIPPAKRLGMGPKPSPNNSPGAERLIHSEPRKATTLNKAYTSGEPGQGNRGKSIPVPLDATSSRPLVDINGDLARLAFQKPSPTSNMVQAMRELESSYETANGNQQPSTTPQADTHLTVETQ